MILIIRRCEVKIINIIISSSVDIVEQLSTYILGFFFNVIYYEYYRIR